MGPINKFDSRVLTQIFYAKTKDEMFYIICMIFTVKLFFLPLFVPSVKEGPLSVLVFSLCTILAGSRVSNPRSCNCSQVSAINDLHTSLRSYTHS